MHTHTRSHTCTFIHTHSHKHIHTHALLYIHTYIYIHIHTYTRTFTYICSHTHSHIHMNIHTHTFTHTYKHIHTHTYLQTHIHTFTPWLSSKPVDFLAKLAVIRGWGWLSLGGTGCISRWSCPDSLEAPHQLGTCYSLGSSLEPWGGKLCFHPQNDREPGNNSISSSECGACSQPQQHLGACWECRFSGPKELNQQLWGSPAVSVFGKPSR